MGHGLLTGLVAHGYTMRHQALPTYQGQQRDLNPQPPYYKYGESAPYGVAWSPIGCTLRPHGPPRSIRWHHNGYTIGTTDLYYDRRRR